MAEIYKSLRALSEGEVRWRVLVGKFHTRLHIPAATGDLSHSLPPFTEQPHAS
jgi:hypothetical protein